MVGGIQLSTLLRNSILSRAQVQEQLSIVDQRLQTGEKVNDLFDNPAVFFKAQSLSKDAAVMLQRKTEIDQGISALKVTTDSIGRIEEMVEGIKGLAEEAKNLPVDQRGHLQKQAVALAQEIDKYAVDASYNGVNLLTGDGRLYGPELVSNGSFEDGVNGWSGGGTPSAAIIDGLTAANVVDADASNRDGILQAVNLTSGSNYLISGLAQKSDVNPAAGTLDLGIYFGLGFNTTPNQEVTLSNYNNWEEYEFEFTAGGQNSFFQMFPTRYNNPHTGEAYFTQTSVREVESDPTFEDTLTINYSDSETRTISSVDLRARALGIYNGEINFSSQANLEATIARVETALDTIDATMDNFSIEFSVFQQRLQMTEVLINTAQEAENKLIAADITEEAANKLALETRDQLVMETLSLAASAQRSIVSLLG